VLAEAGTGEEVLTAEIGASAPRQLRERFPALNDRVLR
jgi:predicted amidohydrolase